MLSTIMNLFRAGIIMAFLAPIAAAAGGTGFVAGVGTAAAGAAAGTAVAAGVAAGAVAAKSGTSAVASSAIKSAVVSKLLAPKPKLLATTNEKLEDDRKRAAILGRNAKGFGSTLLTGGGGIKDKAKVAVKRLLGE